MIRSAGSRQVDRHGSPDQTRRGSSYCYNDKFIIYPFPVMEIL